MFSFSAPVLPLKLGWTLMPPILAQTLCLVLAVNSAPFCIWALHLIADRSKLAGRPSFYLYFITIRVYPSALLCSPVLTIRPITYQHD